MVDSSVANEKYAGQPPLLGAGTGLAVGLGVGISTAEIFENKRIFINMAEQTAKISKDRHWLTHAAIVAFSALSAWAGYSIAKRGKDQFEGVSAALMQQTSRADALQMQVEGLNQEVATHRKSYAELHAKHEQHASHASQNASRAEHGSHAEAALHDKAHAEQELAR
jgi:hypothetical protein